MLVISTRLPKPAIAKVSFQDFRKYGVQVGDWVTITYHDGNNTRSFYCRLWPADVAPDQVLIDDYIQCVSKHFENEQVNTITPVHQIPTAIHATLRVTVKTGVSKDEQQRDIGFVYEHGTKIQKLQYVRLQVEGLIADEGSTISGSWSVLCIEVVSTYPKQGPVLIAPGTRLTLLPHKDERTNATAEEEELASSMSQLSLNMASREKDGKPTGLQKAYDALFEIVSYPLLYRDWFHKLGIECPKGILLYGPPGVGKTYLVSSVAHACGARMMIIHGPEIYGPYIGESEEKLRIKFMEAQEAAAANNVPVILFIDEIDALTPHRDRAQSHENRVVAQLLTLMDGIHSRGRLIVVGATNRPNAIDPALRRPGRFDREISIDVPDASTRERLFASHMRNMPTDHTVNPEILATFTNGYVAADIASVCREAAFHAVNRVSKSQKGEVYVSLNDFGKALSSVSPSIQRGYQVQVEKKNWEDVGGLRDVKKQLKQAVEWPILHRETFKRLGLKPPRGILLYGPPGCSKTTLVKVIASSSGAAFLSINGAQLYSPYVGDSEKIIRTTFQKARASAPAIIFLDETEAIVGKRNMGNGGSSGDSVQERVLSTLLNEMDGVELAESVLVVGATNRPDMLDAALMRPGRFDRLIYVPPPDYDARLEILKIHTRHMPLAGDVDLQKIASRTDLYTGADLQNVCREAAMVALRSMRTACQVEMSHFEKSLATIPPSVSPSMLEMYSKPATGE